MLLMGILGCDLYLLFDLFVLFDVMVKVKLFECIEQMVCGCDLCIMQVMVGFVGEYDVVLVVCSDGVFVVDICLFVCVLVMVIVEQNGCCEIGLGGGGGCFDYGYFIDDVLLCYVDDVVYVVFVNFDVCFVLVGVMMVVFGLGWLGVLLYEVIGYGFEGDFNCKGLFVFVGWIGEQVVVKGVMVVDDGMLLNCCGLLNIDDEGNLMQCMMLIEDGILKGYIQDMLNVCLMKMLVMGNVWCELYVVLLMLCMMNIYMLNGDKDLQEIIVLVKNGLYVVNFGGGQVDIMNGKFVFLVFEVYMIENGKIIYLVKGVMLIGSGLELLKYVSMIGNDMLFDMGVGVCGKEGQSVLVGVGQLILWIDKMMVGGMV